MVSLEPKTRITIRVPVTQIQFIAGKTQLSYEEVKDRIETYLTFLKKKNNRRS